MPTSPTQRSLALCRKLLAIDPGTTESAVVRIVNGKVEPLGMLPNEDIVDMFYTIASDREDRHEWYDAIACEWIECMGMAVGKETFETVYWIGRFHEAAPCGFHRVTRRQVKLNLCGNMKAKDANIRQALLDRYGGSSAVGRKKSPGPLYGISSHQWSALAVGVTFLDDLNARAGEVSALGVSRD